MVKISASQLARIMERQQVVVEAWIEPLNAAMQQYGIDTPMRQAAFFAQIGHESGSLGRLVENLNYSAEALRRVWPSRFTQSLALRYERRPEAIANFVYSNRMGNGTESSGDGWKYRGRGLIQVTGKDNYRRCGLAIKENLLDYPELLQLPHYAALSAAWFWSSNRLSILADTGKFDQITRKINGGTTGAADRNRRYALAREVLKC